MNYYSNNSIKEQMLGTLKLRTVTGAFQPSREDLTRPREGPASVGYGFCQGCGMILEITTQGRDIFQTDFGIHIPDNTIEQEQYVHFSRCIYCATQFQDPEMRQIPQ